MFINPTLNGKSVFKSEPVIKKPIAPKEEITGFFRGEIRKTKASNDGKWRLVFINASSGGPYNLKLLGKNTIELNNVFVGEVWFCSGQSNMGWPLYKSENGIDEIVSININEVH